MKNLKNKIHLLEEQIETQEKEKQRKLFLMEMKKIGIEKLPYAFSALKQFIDPETMSYHYNKHYKGYVDKLNDALQKKKGGDVELEEIIKNISRYDKTIRNNAGGAFNHALFWKMLSPQTQRAKGNVVSHIEKEFGNFNNFKKKFEQIAKERFGSGWVWLVITKRNSLKIMSTPNQDNPLMNVIENGGYPLLGLDLWEHAYYLKYRNKRDMYIKNFWKAVNWDFVNQLYDLRNKTKNEQQDRLQTVIAEGKSQRCSKEDTKKIKELFNTNSQVKRIYQNTIQKILKEVFPEHYYERNQYSEGQQSGIYDFEGDGRSVINKLNTNYTCFCILLNDLNMVAEKMKKRKINFDNKTPEEQIEEAKRFANSVRYFKNRIFDRNSSTFENIMATLMQTHKTGEKTEEIAAAIMKKKFGYKNVRIVGELGGAIDMFEDTDAVITIDGKEYTAQIKPFGKIIEEDDKFIMVDTGQVKPNKTDWLVFQKGKLVFIFDNLLTDIVDGKFTFPSSALLYTIES